MTDTEGYNGWKNYETWCVNLWLSNDQGTDEAIRAIVAELVEEYDDGPGTDVPRLTGAVADAIQSFTEELPECVAVQETASFVSDLLGASLWRVDWREIAKAWMEES